MDGPDDLEASDDLRFDIEDPLSFWYRYGRHPYRSLNGMPKFMITSAGFRYVDSSHFWRFTVQRAEDLLKQSWPGDGAEGLEQLRRISGYEPSGTVVPGTP